jgi:hypothetical protein
VGKVCEVNMHGRVVRLLLVKDVRVEPRYDSVGKVHALISRPLLSATQPLNTMVCRGIISLS